jgi:hypothetical protein
MTEAGMISMDHQRVGLGKDGDGGKAGGLRSRYDVTEPSSLTCKSSSQPSRQPHLLGPALPSLLYQAWMRLLKQTMSANTEAYFPASDRV